MKRSGVTLEEVAAFPNLLGAHALAAKASRDAIATAAFARTLEGNLISLRNAILDGSVEVGRMRAFWIRDPKRRLIHAPAFEERVLHHALMAKVGPVLERRLVDDTFACRKGKGTLAAVKRAQHHARRYSYYAQIDIRGYFPSIDHEVLNCLLSRNLKHPGVRHLCARIIDGHHATPGCGLPIGALTSQHFANAYLASLDRFLADDPNVRGMVRYMDDVVWWCDGRREARSVLRQVIAFAQEVLKLNVKQPARLGPSARGLSFCGYRITPARLSLSKRTRKRYVANRREWERSYAAGEIVGGELQRGMQSVVSATVHADARGWRCAQMLRSPVSFDA